MRIDVVIPCYNCKETIGRAIDSVRAQTCALHEIIVVNDGSSDGMDFTVLEHTDRVRVLHQTNRGPGAARNLAAAHSCADWLAMLDADDWWLPDKLRKQVDLLNEVSPDVALVFSKSNLSKPLKNLEVTFKDLWRSNLIPCSSALVRRSVFDSVGGFNEDRRLMSNEDYNLWLRIALAGYRIVGRDEALVFYAPGGLSGDMEAFLEASLFNIRDVGSLARISSAEIRRKSAEAHEGFGRGALWRRNLRFARRCFWNAFWSSPSWTRVVYLVISQFPTSVLNAGRDLMVWGAALWDRLTTKKAPSSGPG